MSDDNPRKVTASIELFANNYMIVDRYIRVPMSRKGALAFVKRRYDGVASVAEDLFDQAEKCNRVTFTTTIAEGQLLEPKFKALERAPDPYAVPIIDTLALVSGDKAAGTSGLPLKLSDVKELLKDSRMAHQPKTESDAAELVSKAIWDIQRNLGCRCAGRCNKCLIKPAVRKTLSDSKMSTEDAYEAYNTRSKSAAVSDEVFPCLYGAGPEVYMRNRPQIITDMSQLKSASDASRQQFLEHGFSIIEPAHKSAMDPGEFPDAHGLDIAGLFDGSIDQKFRDYNQQVKDSLASGANKAVSAVGDHRGTILKGLAAIGGTAALAGGAKLWYDKWQKSKEDKDLLDEPDATDAFAQLKSAARQAVLEDEQSDTTVVYEDDIESILETPTVAGLYLVPAADDQLTEMLLLPMKDGYSHGDCCGSYGGGIESTLPKTTFFVVPQEGDNKGLFSENVEVPPSRLVNSRVFAAMEGADGVEYELLKPGKLTAKYVNKTRKGQPSETRNSLLLDGNGNVLRRLYFWDDVKVVESPSIDEAIVETRALIIPKDKPHYILSLPPMNRVSGKSVVGTSASWASAEFRRRPAVTLKIDAVNGTAETLVGSTKAAGTIKEVVDYLMVEKGIGTEDIFKLAAGAKGSIESSMNDHKEEPADSWIGVDLDGTLAKHYTGPFEETKIGAPVEKMVNRVKEWLDDGKTVKILTARAATMTDAARKAVEAWCKEHIGQVLEITAMKDPGMTELWDDRAISIKADTGEVVKAASGTDICTKYRSLLERHDVDPDNAEAVAHFEARAKSDATKEADHPLAGVMDAGSSKDKSANPANVMGVDQSQSGLPVPQLNDVVRSPYGIQEQDLPAQELEWQTQRPQYEPTPLYAESDQGQQQSLSGAYNKSKPMGDLSFMRSLMRESNLEEQLSKNVKELTKAMDACGRLLFTFYQQHNQYLELYGEDEMEELEDLLRDMFKQNGKLVLFLKQKSIAASNAGHTIDITD